MCVLNLASQDDDSCHFGGCDAVACGGVVAPIVFNKRYIYIYTRIYESFCDTESVFLSTQIERVESQMSAYHAG